jgi:hypothetical protein
MPEATKSKGTLAAKLVRIMSQVERVPKNGFNDHHRYHYATEADVIEACRNFMAEENVLLIPSVEDVQQIKDGITRIRVRFTYICADTGESIEFIIVSDGQDKQDKAPYKALTGAHKYALMKTLNIPTGDDPEREGASGQGRQNQQQQNTQARNTGGQNRSQGTSNRDQGRNQNSGPRYATTKQLDLIRDEARRLNFSEEYLCSFMSRVHKVNIQKLEDLYTKGASTLIDALKNGEVG